MYTRNKIFIKITSNTMIMEQAEWQNESTENKVQQNLRTVLSLVDQKVREVRK